MTHEIYKPYEDSQYNDGVVLEEYNGVYSLVSASQSDEGPIYKRWCFPQVKDKQPAEKAIPMKVKLGGPREAVKMLEYFLSQLTNEPVEDDIPF